MYLSAIILNALRLAPQDIIHSIFLRFICMIPFYRRNVPNGFRVQVTRWPLNGFTL
jgi:hypothetical protein